jgi:hypothetical protein
MQPSEACALVTAIGGAFSNLGVYGAQHPVTRESMQRGAQACTEALAARSRLDIVTHGAHLIVNGAAVATSLAPTAMLCERLAAAEAHTLSITPPLGPEEFETFIGLLAAPPAAQKAAGGFGAALAQAGLVRFKVGRIGVQTDAEPAPKPKPHTQRAGRSTRTGRSFDLSAELATLEQSLQDTAQRPDKDAVAALRDTIDDLKARVRADRGLAGGDATRELTDALQRVEHAIRELLRQTERKAGGLVANVRADREIVARIEQDAQSHGMDLHVTRDQLLSGLSEVVQESYQPLTVVTGGVDLLRSGRLGPVSDAQDALLGTVSESMARLETLITFLRNIAGAPESLSPDAAVLREAYRAGADAP